MVTSFSWQLLVSLAGTTCKTLLSMARRVADSPTDVGRCLVIGLEGVKRGLSDELIVLRTRGNFGALPRSKNSRAAVERTLNPR